MMRSLRSAQFTNARHVTDVRRLLAIDHPPGRRFFSPARLARMSRRVIILATPDALSAV